MVLRGASGTWMEHSRFRATTTKSIRFLRLLKRYLQLLAFLLLAGGALYRGATLPLGVVKIYTSVHNVDLSLSLFLNCVCLCMCKCLPCKCVSFLFVLLKRH
uniref:(northern house mosquito) hypothetical protein n=1 Tax=Culex pipiens TaxID=7175 RepID=A0A8D8FX96_CULPI